MNELKWASGVDKAPADPSARAAHQTYKTLTFVVDSFRLGPVLPTASSSLYTCYEIWEKLRQKIKSVTD
jgi:hypothetical protein